MRSSEGGGKKMRSAVVAMSVAGMFLFPQTAFSQSVLQIDTYGNGRFIAEVFNSISVLSGSGLPGLIRLGLVAGILFAVVSALFGGSVSPSRHFAVSLLVYMTLFGVKVDVAVSDRVTSYSRIITGVPAGVGVFAWATAGVGSGLTRLMETAFSLPGTLRYSKNGLLRGAELIKRSAAFTVAEPHLANTLNSFVRECGLKSVTSGLLTPDSLQKSDDLLSSMNMTNYKLVELHTNIALAPSAYSSPSSLGDCTAARRPVLAYCGEAHAGIAACLNSYYPGWEEELAEESGFVNGNSNVVDTGGFTSALSESYSRLAGISASAKEIIIQNAMINSYSRSVRSLAVASGGEAQLLSLSIAEAQARQKHSFIVFGEMARHTLPYIRGLLQGMLYGIFPAVIFLAMTPLAARIIPAYLTAMFWTELWNPIYAIVNLFSNLRLERTLVPYSDGALTIVSRGSLAHESDMAMAVAGLAATIVPMVAYYVVSASQHAVVGAVQQFMGPTQSVSTQTAGAHATGNISLGNVSVATGRYDTLTAHKSDTARETVTGNAVRRYDNVYTSEASSVGGIRITGSEGVRYAAREELADTRKNMETSRSAVTESAASASGRIFTAQSGSSRGRTYSEMLGSSSQTSESSNLATVLETARALEEKFGLSRQESLRMSWDTATVYDMGAKVGASGNSLGGVNLGAGSFGAGVRGRAVRGTDRTAGESWNEAREFAESANSKVNFTRALSELETAFDSKETRDSLQLSEQDTEQVRAELVHAENSLKEYSSLEEKAGVYSELLSGESSFAAGIESEYTQSVFEDMRDRGYSDDYTAKGLSDLRDRRYDTEQAEEVSASIHRVTGLSDLVGSGKMPRESASAMPDDSYGIQDVTPFDVDPESSFSEYRKSASGVVGSDTEEIGRELNINAEAVKERIKESRESVRQEMSSGETQTARDMETEKQEILREKGRVGGSTEGVRKRLEKAQTADDSAEDKTSRLAKSVRSNREQQVKAPGKQTDSSSAEQ